MRQLDKIDLEIISLLTNNGRIPLKELSKKVYLTTPAVSARLDKLIKDGYITGIHASVDEEKLGYGIKAFIFVSVQPEDNQMFYEFINSEKCVRECNHITGYYSMLLEVIFTTTTLLDEFLGRLQKFGKTETHVVFSTMKKHLI